MRPGKDSFTRTLIYALKALVEKRPDGRFTTVELLNKIKEAPDFPKDQNPTLSNREKKGSTGRIMLHPLPGTGSAGALSRRETASLPSFEGHTLTLHIDFSEKPSGDYLERFGRGLNEFFQLNVGVNRVRWGGMRQAMAARYARYFQAQLKRNRSGSMRLQRATAGNGSSYARPAENSLDPPTPCSVDQQSPRSTEPAVKGSPEFDPADISAMPFHRSIDSNDESEGHTQDHGEPHKRRKIAFDRGNTC